MKKVIFILRGLGREQRQWGDFPLLLEQKTGCEVVQIDLPGFGLANKESAPYSVLEIAKKIISRGLFEKFKSYDKRFIFGLSLGGMVSLELVNQQPGYFDGIVLVNSSQKYKNSLYRRLNFNFIPKAAYAILGASTLKRETIIFEETINNPKNKEKIINDWVRFFEERPYKKKSFLAQLIAASKFSIKGMDFSKIPGLVLTSKADRLVDWRSSLLFSKLLNWPICYHDNAGHDLSFDDPEWICDKVYCFINKED